MANRRIVWKEILKRANEDLNRDGCSIEVKEDEGFFSATIIFQDGTRDLYAENFYEDELDNLITDAWHYAKSSLDEYKAVPETSKGAKYANIVLTVRTDADNPEAILSELENRVNGIIGGYVVSQCHASMASPETLAEQYEKLTDAEKDEFLEMTGNQ